MIGRIARYRVKEDWLPEAQPVIEAFVAAIAANEPRTVYAAYQEGDSPDFIHFMTFPNPEAERNHQQADYTSEFVAALYPNCEIEPTFTDLNLVASTGAV